LLYIDATNNIQVSGAIIDAFDQSLTRKGEEDKKNIQLLKAALNELHYISSPSVKLRIKGVKQLLKKST
jgi:hypothetical protein